MNILLVSTKYAPGQVASRCYRISYGDFAFVSIDLVSSVLIPFNGIMESRTGS